MNDVAAPVLVAQLGSGESLDRIARNLRLADRSMVSAAMGRHGITRQRNAAGVLLIVQHRHRD